MQTNLTDESVQPEPAAPLPVQPAALRALHDSYNRLLVKVATIERELSRANAALREKVAALDEANQKLDAVLDAVPAGVVVVDPRGTVTRVNANAGAIVGAASESLVGRSIAEITNPRGTALLNGPSRELEAEGLDGQPRFLARSRSAVKDAAGRVSATVILLEDRTEKKRLEERLKHHQTLAALGEMSATVAHEVRNPLHGIEGFANLLVRSLSDTPELVKSRGFARNIVKGVRDLNNTITNLLEFARVERFHPVERDVVNIARRAIDLSLAGADTSRFSVVLHSPDSVPVSVDEVHITQAIRNLITNAIDAMPSGGRTDVNISVESGGVNIRVSDEGPGIRPELRQRVFTPFFTTKSRGTGLGLAIVAKAASIHGGRAAVASSEKGAVFNLWLPNINHQQQEL